PLAIAAGGAVRHAAGGDILGGELSGGGSFNVGTNQAFVLALTDAAFGGVLALGGSAGGLTVRGGATQTLLGDTTALDGTIAAGSTAALTFAGTAAATAANVSAVLA